MSALVVGHAANTPSKVARYLSSGADGVEIDVFWPDIAHPPENQPKRLSGAVARWVLQAFTTRLRRHRVAEVLDAAREMGAKVVVLDIKVAPPQAFEGVGDVIFTSKNHLLLRRLAEEWGHVVYPTIHSRPVSPWEVVEEAGGKGASIHYSFVDEELIRELKERGLGIMVWTINDAATAMRLVEAGADFITTDRPELVAPAVRYGVLPSLYGIYRRASGSIH